MAELLNLFANDAQLDAVVYRAQFMATDACYNVRKFKEKVMNELDKVERLRARMEKISGMDYSKDRIQTTPDPDSLANDVEQLIADERRLQHYITEYNLRYMILETDCIRAGFSPQQTQAILLYYSDLEGSYNNVAHQMNISKEQARYLIQGKGYGKYCTEFKLSEVYLDTMKSIEFEPKYIVKEEKEDGRRIKASSRRTSPSYAIGKPTIYK